MKILVVDDSACDNLLIRTALVNEGYDVVSAYNGSEALEMIKKEKPGLILSDLMMPVMDGFEMMENIKSNLATSHIPVIVLSAKNNVIESAIDMGAVDFLKKPVDKVILVDKVKKAVEIHLN